MDDVWQVDSVKKLRWYDREDLSQLVEINTRDKLQLQETIAALRQVCPLMHLPACTYLRERGSAIVALDALSPYPTVRVTAHAYEALFQLLSQNNF